MCHRLSPLVEHNNYRQSKIDRIGVLALVEQQSIGFFYFRSHSAHPLVLVLATLLEQKLRRVAVAVKHAVVVDHVELCHHFGRGLKVVQEPDDVPAFQEAVSVATHLWASATENMFGSRSCNHTSAPWPTNPRRIPIPMTITMMTTSLGRRYHSSFMIAPMIRPPQKLSNAFVMVCLPLTQIIQI